MTWFHKRRRSPQLGSSVLLLCAAQGHAFSLGANRPSTLSLGSNGRSMSAISAEPGISHALQHVWDELVDGAELQDVEKLLMGVETGLFPQASAWAKTWTPMRCVVAEVADSRSISVLVLPREYDMIPRRRFSGRCSIISSQPQIPACWLCFLPYCNTFFKGCSTVYVHHCLAVFTPTARVLCSMRSFEAWILLNPLTDPRPTTHDPYVVTPRSREAIIPYVVRGFSKNHAHTTSSIKRGLVRGFSKNQSTKSRKCSRYVGAKIARQPLNRDDSESPCILLLCSSCLHVPLHLLFICLRRIMAL